ncbi:MAG: diguanylate cyclase [Pseudomonadota bacterium]
MIKIEALPLLSIRPASPLGVAVLTWTFGILLQVVLAGTALADAPILVNGSEKGLRLQQNFMLWQDPSAHAQIEDAAAAYASGEFSLPGSLGSTGLAQGAFWSRFELQNTSDRIIDLRLEYIDHQLVNLRAFQRDQQATAFEELADLSLYRPFSERPIPHHRFVVPVTLSAGETAEFFVEYRSHQMGFVFPELRIWSPPALSSSQAKELTFISFIVGGLLVMAFIAVVSGFATGSSFFHAYAFHALASICVWFTVFGFAHQFLITENYHWRYMSITGAVSLFTGLYFAREFLQSREFMPRFDYLLLLLMVNTVFLAVSALLGQSTLAVISITLALLLYPAVSVAGVVRWQQGAREAGVFTFAWTFLVVGLVLQALRDLGLVQHNFSNYYWPALASYGEMAVILIAMGVRIRDLRKSKECAEKAQVQQLEASKELLEAQVAERTRELEAAKTAAEIEALTDTLTGVNNRRSFLNLGQRMLDRSIREGLPLTLMMLDIDHFKAINDSYGHDMGDRALEAFAEAMMHLVRDRDLFGRLGGEEFALMMISSPEDAVQTAERLRRQVKEIRLDATPNPVQFSASVGVAHRGNEADVETLLKRADVALYQAKDGGRDRVQVCGAAAPQGTAAHGESITDSGD